MQTSAAESGCPEPDCESSVVRLDRWPGRRVPRQDPRPVEPVGERNAEAELAGFTQAYFRDRGRTLTDPEVAADVRITLELVGHVVDSARAAGHIDEQARDRLWGMLDGIRRAPDSL